MRRRSQRLERSSSLAAALLANVLVLAVLVFAAALESSDPRLYYQSLQEDGTLEWATFWAFGLAAVAGLWVARGQWRATSRLPWFSVGVAAFCAVVAMEEISWGQRLIGFRPPPYFLEHNYQQELNLHNVFSTSLRKLVVSAILAGYGVGLPLLGLVPALAAWLRRLGVFGPPAALAPAFLAALVAYRIYPWSFTGEVVEAMMGLGFLFAAVLRGVELGGTPQRPSLAVLASAATVLCLGAGNAALSRSWRSDDPGALESARVELEALARDLEAETRARRGRLPLRCGVHKRLYGFVLDNDGDFFRTGEFVDLVERGLPEQRADFLIDPWGTAYWVRYECDADRERRSLFLYSFGPNRLRDSSELELLGDDVGVYVVQDWEDEEEDDDDWLEEDAGEAASGR